MLSIILAPFSWLYGAVMRLRNFFYDYGIKKSFSFDVAVISVGNLSIGGTGKSPMIEYLVRMLSDKYQVAILSRGYGRKTRGFRMASAADDASTIGDEPFQFYKKYKDKVSVIVCEDRVVGINRLLSLKPVQVILMDDAFQHRRVRPLFSILLTVFSNPFFSDFILPMGRLREPRKGSSRSDAMVVTKCEVLNNEKVSRYQNEIWKYAGSKPVFFSSIGYTKPVPFENSSLGKDVILVTGIASSKPMVEYVSKKINLLHHFEFGDHHNYTSTEVGEIQLKAITVGASILTTEKDFVKLEKMVDKKLWFYLPIESRLLNTGSEFDELVLNKIKSHLSR